MRRMVLLIFALTILALASCQGTAVAPPTSTPGWVTYDDWPTYTDVECGFAIQYPPNWEVRILPERPNAVYFASKEMEEQLLGGIRVIEGVTVEETVDHEVETVVYRIGGEILEQTEDVLNGYPGVRLVHRTGERAPLTTWVLSHNGRIYILGVTPETGGGSYEEMLATFRFLNGP